MDHLYNERDQASGAYAIDLTVGLRTARMREVNAAPPILSQSAARHMYWTMAQIVAHHASNGCDLRPGDLLGTGTLSAPEPSGFGSLLETTKGGAEPVALSNGETRGFLEDGDEVTFTGRAHADRFVSIGFGACVGIVDGAPK